MIKDFPMPSTFEAACIVMCKRMDQWFSKSIKCGLLLSFSVFSAPALSVEEEAFSMLIEQTESFKSGWKAAQSGQLEQANKIWSALNEEKIIVPELTRALQNNLAVLLIKQENYLQAETLLNSALKSDPQIATTLDNLNQLYTYQAQKTYQKVFRKTAVKLPKAEFLFFDIKTATLPTENVEITPPKFSADAPYLAQLETQDVLQVKGLLDKWRLAWVNQDINEYLSYYHSKEFIPKEGMSYSAWQKSRHGSLQRPKFIKIAFDEIQVVQLDKNLIRARFLQKYESDRFKDDIFKVVLWQLNDGQWKIVQEVVASANS